MRIFLHIGPPKSGSSSIQTVLHRMAPEMEPMGYYVPGPVAGGGGANSRINDDLVDGEDSIHKAIDEANARNCDLVLSTEYVFDSINFIDRGHSARLRTRLQRDGISLHLSAIFRDPFSRGVSIYKQALLNTARNHKLGKDFLQGDHALLSLGEINSRLQRLAQVLTARSVSVFFMKGDWLSDYLRHIDSRLVDMVPDVPHENVSVPDVYCEIIRQFNATDPDTSRNVHFRRAIKDCTGVNHVVLNRQAARFNDKHRVLDGSSLDFISFQKNPPLFYTPDEFEAALRTLREFLRRDALAGQASGAAG